MNDEYDAEFSRPNPAPAGVALVELTAGLHRALHPAGYLPPPA